MAGSPNDLLTSIRVSSHVGSQLDRIAERLENAILNRAAGQTLSSDFKLAGENLPAGALQMTATSWPTISALDARSPWVTVNPNSIPIVWTVAPLPAPATKQPLEKAALSSFTITLKLGAANTLNTFAGYSNVAVQTFDDGPRWVAAMLRAGVARQADKFVADALVAAGGAGVSLAAAVGPMATAWPGELIVIAPVGSPNLAACGYPVIVDPLITAAVLVAPSGISFAVQGPDSLSNIEPNLLGHGVAAGAIVTEVNVAAGAATKITSLAAVPA
jgi:hypothetical protein